MCLFFFFQIVVVDFKWMLSILSSQGISIFVREARSFYNINFVANAKEDGLSGVDLTHFRHKLRIEQREREKRKGGKRGMVWFGKWERNDGWYKELNRSWFFILSLILMAKVEEFILYSIVVFNVTSVYDDDAHTVIFGIWSHFLRNWWVWISILALFWWLGSWTISTYSLYSTVIVFQCYSCLWWWCTYSHLWYLKSLPQELVGLDLYLSLILMAG